MKETQSTWKRKSILFLISQCITLFGSSIVQMAVMWYVTLETTSGAWVAAFSVCACVPQFLLSFVGGVWADKHSRKKLILVADGTIAAVTFLMFLLIPHISSNTGVLVGLLIMSAIRSFGAGIQTPAVNAVIPQIVPTEHLMRYNGFNATMQSIVNFAAPVAAGAVLSVSSLHMALLIDVATAVVGVGVLSCIWIPKEINTNENGSFLADMKAGITYSFSHKLLGRLLLVYGIFIFLCVPAGFMTALLVSRVYGDTYWYLTAVELVGFIGMTGGGILMGTWGGFKNRVTTLSVGLGVFGVLAIGMGLSRNFILYLVLSLLYGIAITMVQTATMTLIQEQAEPSLQGRIFGLMGSMYSGFLPVGMLIFGPLADMIPLQGIMIGTGVGLFVVALYVSMRNFSV